MTQNLEPYTPLQGVQTWLLLLRVLSIKVYLNWKHSEQQQSCLYTLQQCQQNCTYEIQNNEMMAVNGVLEGVKSIDMDVCASCVMKKYKRVSFTKAAKKPQKVRLEMVHTDVQGPSPVSSFLVPKFHWLDVSHPAATTLCCPKAIQISHYHTINRIFWRYILIISQNICEIFRELLVQI